MVKKIIIVLFLFCSSIRIEAQENDSVVEIRAEIDPYKAFENHPLQGTITVTHDMNNPIDTSSFQMNGTPLKADLVKTVRISPEDTLVISIYQFERPGQSHGTYSLPKIGVKIGSKMYYSLTSTYEVQGAAPALTDQATSKPVLELKAGVEGPSPLYPGQHTLFIYRFYFSGDIELVSEVLPLLDAKGFVKVGEKQIKDSQQSGLNIQEIVQEVQAKEPGTFVFPESSAEGYAYKEDLLKNRTYIQPKLQTKVLPITVVVNAFPAENKPATFNGASGQFALQVSLLTPSTMMAEDKILLAIDISGAEGLDSVTAPDLSKSGFKRFFRLGDLPSVGTVNGNTKRFTVELYPLTSAIKTIPPVFFSYFDSANSRYVTLKSDPIPIDIKQSSPEKLPEKQKEQAPAIEPEKNIPEVKPTPIPLPVPAEETKIYKPEPIEISGNLPLTSADLFDKTFGTWKSLWYIPFGTIFIGVLVFLRKYAPKKLMEAKQIHSTDLLKTASQVPGDSAQFYQLIQDALMLSLVEKGEIASKDISVHDLPAEGHAGIVKAFLSDIEVHRYTRTVPLSPQEVLKKAKTLINGMQ